MLHGSDKDLCSCPTLCCDTLHVSTGNASRMCNPKIDPEMPRRPPSRSSAHASVVVVLFTGTTAVFGAPGVGSRKSNLLAVRGAAGTIDVAFKAGSARAPAGGGAAVPGRP